MRMPPMDPDGFFRCWTTDAHGERVLVGLTAEETKAYLDHKEAWFNGSDRRDNRERWLELHDRHEAARLAVVSAEIEVRENNPTFT